MSTSTFRETVALVAARAKALLPASINGRLEGAVKLVLGHDVEPQADGTVLVGSCTDPLKQYRLVGTACECKDFTDGKAPEGWCRHRIAAGIHKRVHQEFSARAPEVERETEVILPEEMEPYPDNDAEETPMPPTPAAVPCPEALFSLTLKGHIDGHEALLTARGQTADEFQRNLAAIRGLLDAPASPQGPAGQEQGPQASPPSASEEQRWCPKHGDKMQRNEKEGRSWWSHRHAGQWCKGQGGRS